MRIWSIHPSYLDSKGLVALWREGLLALNVLEGKTVGYKSHPQLDRFKESYDPVMAMNVYLEEVLKEATRRGYNFDSTKIRVYKKCPTILVTDGQLSHEVKHLTTKLEKRDPKRFKEISEDNNEIIPHPLFRITKGDVEPWERVTDGNKN